MTGKAKVSVTVRRGLLQEVDRLAGTASRSAVFEQALVSWVRGKRRAGLDHAIEAYYRSLDDGDRAEDAAWADLGDEAVRDTWGGR